MRISLSILFAIIFTAGVSAQIIVRPKLNAEKTDADIKTGAERTTVYLPWLEGKNVAVVANQTSMINSTSLVDSLLALKVKVKKIFCPEHGFRGTAENGEDVGNSVDTKTGLPLISLYGDHVKPLAKDLKGIDVVVYDIQDVGVRCYTYLTTMSYVMEACAEQKKTFIVLDRPNPNGYYVDGPVLEPENKSFVGMHPVPLVYGMTIAEYALMLNGEKWLANGVQCDLKTVSCENYVHSDWYQLPVAPSPNLPNMASVYLYPTLCLFEGTVMSIGRGTDLPFQVVGHPKLKNASFQFTPTSHPGAKKPLYENQICYGHDLHDFAMLYVRDYKGLYLYWLLSSYKDMPDQANYFNDFFEKLAGTKTLRQQIIAGNTEEQIKATWRPGIIKFKIIRKKYLLYEDFE
ncbi:MAG TPA: DUF1343 domain-containing protein [Bacteroidia bacterium]|nr:DUF1343 domain-containing protein [Bacteroidia bacterium]